MLRARGTELLTGSVERHSLPRRQLGLVREADAVIIKGRFFSTCLLPSEASKGDRGHTLLRLRYLMVQHFFSEALSS